jgi:hypothetical protein
MLQGSCLADDSFLFDLREVLSAAEKALRDLNTEEDNYAPTSRYFS